MLRPGILIHGHLPTEEPQELQLEILGQHLHTLHEENGSIKDLQEHSTICSSGTTAHVHASPYWVR
jgi:hypothetical protein